jgi:hypothetical protein
MSSSISIRILAFTRIIRGHADVIISRILLSYAGTRTSRWQSSARVRSQHVLLQSQRITRCEGACRAAVGLLASVHHGVHTHVSLQIASLTRSIRALTALERLSPVCVRM